MLNMNRATLLGYAGRDPESRELPSGDVVAKFTLATTERYRRQSGERAESTDWHNIVAYGHAAGAVQELVRKGDPVYVEGRVSYREYEDESGSRQRVTEIVVAGPRGVVNVLAPVRSGADDA